MKKGDIIGLVSSTEFSTGPHMHFTFWAHNVPVNPNLFFDTMPFHWLEEARGESAAATSASALSNAAIQRQSTSAQA